MRGRHCLQLEQYSGGHWTDYAYLNSRPADYIARSMLVYNRLPVEIVEGASSVSSFQASLQNLLKSVAISGVAHRSHTFAPVFRCTDIRSCSRLGGGRRALGGQQAD